MAWINVDVDIDIDEHLSEASTEALKEELRSREWENDVLLPEPPEHIISDIKKAFEVNNPHEFYFLLRKVESYLEAVNA